MNSQKTFSFPLKWVILLSFLYLLIPNILFLIGWLSPGYSLSLSFLLFAATVYTWEKVCERYNRYNVCFKISIKEIIYLLTTLLFLLVPLELSGMLGHVPQPTDHAFRNAIYSVLCNERWPIYAPNGDYFVYYHTFFLFPALISKYLGDFIEPRVILFIWSYIGLSLAIMLLFIRLRAKTFIYLLILLLLGNLSDIPNGFFRLLCMCQNRGSFGDSAIYFFQHLGYGGHMHFFHSWGQLMYTYNSFIPGLVFMGLLLSRRIPLPLLPVPAALIVSQTPIVALSVLVFFATLTFSHKTLIIKFINVPNIICSIFLIAPGLYFNCQMQSTIHPIWDYEPIMGLYEQYTFRECYVRLIRCGINIIGVILPLILILNKRFYRTSYFKTVIILPFAFSFIWIGRACNEFCIKGPLVMFVLLSLLYLTQYKYSSFKRKCVIIGFIFASALHIPGDFQHRRSYNYSWDNKTIEKNIRQEWGSSLYHPDDYEYGNFFGENRYPYFFSRNGKSIIRKNG